MESDRYGTDLFVMVELPSTSSRLTGSEMMISGGSIGSNDLVQTVYAVSRDDLRVIRTPSMHDPHL